MKMRMTQLSAVFLLAASGVVAAGNGSGMGMPDVNCSETVITSPEGCLVASEYLKINDRASVDTDLIRAGSDRYSSQKVMELGNNARAKASERIDVLGYYFSRNQNVGVKSLNFRDYISGLSLTTQNQSLSPLYLRSKATIDPDMANVEIKVRRVTPGSGFRAVEGGRTVTLQPGRYGDVIVRARGELRLKKGGQYHFASLVVEDGATLTLNNIKAVHEVLVEREFRWGDRVRFNHPQNSLILYTNQGNPAQSNPATTDISVNGNFTGKIYAPFGKLILGNGKQYLGCIFARNIELHQDSKFSGDNTTTKKVCECVW